jgi:UDP-N-acetylmuramoyl-tripeptide--D-alanyl-D-alanine ligase
MQSMSIEQVCQAVFGKPLMEFESSSRSIVAVCADTRNLESDCLFVAIAGDKFDGHEYLAQAAAGGAVAALIDRWPKELPANLPCIQVPNTRRGMGHLAKYIRDRLNCTVIAVAGSNGKTSTKRLIDAALRVELAGSISPKSFNNEIGVPLAIFASKADDDYLVLELGTNHHGEIAVLSNISRPDIAVITNCAEEHLEGLDDLDGVRTENASIISSMNGDGTLIVNGDDPELLKAVEEFPGEKMTFGFARTNDLFATDVMCATSGTSFRLNGKGKKIFVPLLGRHAAVNALAAIGVGRRLDLMDEKIIEGLADTTAADMRLQLTKVGGVTVLNDAYNANPASMKAALETLCLLPAAGRRVAVLGEMRELGEFTESAHRQIGLLAASCPLDALLCVGPLAKVIADSAIAGGMAGRVVSWHPDAQSAAEAMMQWLDNGDVVLLKASRAVGLEKVADVIGATDEQRVRLKDAG